MRHATPLQRAVAFVGFAAMAAATALLWDGAQPDWLWRTFILWCVAVPYWHYLEYRILAPVDEAGRRRFLEQQALSRTVWLGGALVLAVALLR